MAPKNKPSNRPASHPSHGPSGAHSHPSHGPSGARPDKNAPRSGSSSSSVDKPASRPVTNQPGTGLGASADEELVDLTSDLLRILDSDHTGTIDGKEWQECCASLGCVLNDYKNLKESFDRVDQDHDGQITKEELLADIEQICAVMGKRKMCAGLQTAIDIALKHQEEEDNPFNVVEMAISAEHPRHPGFTLGGRAENLVVQVLGNSRGSVNMEGDGFFGDVAITLQKGWKVLSCDGVPMKGIAVMMAATKAKEEERDFYVAFEVDAATKQRLGKKALSKAHARQQLREFLGNRSLVELDQLSNINKSKLLQDMRLQWLCVDASAVFELEVLTGKKTGDMMQLVHNLFRSVKRDDKDQVMHLLNQAGPACNVLLQRDGAGNTCLHYAQSVEMMKLLSERQPGAEKLLNEKGQLPGHVQLINHPEEVGIVSMFMEQGLDELFHLDSSGVNAAMRTKGPARKAVESAAPPWTALATTLEQDDISSILPSLRELICNEAWPGLLAWHVFGESAVWEVGRHTKQSRAYLKVVWKSLDRALAEIAAHNKDALELARALLNATKGPQNPRLDPRAPYREEICNRIFDLQDFFSMTLSEMYSSLRGDAAQWLKNQEECLDDELVQRGALHNAGLKASSLHGKGVRFRLDTPAWVLQPDAGQALKDLEEVGMAGAFHADDAVYDMIQLARADNYEASQEDCLLSRWYGAWLRGICQGQQAEVGTSVKQTLGAVSASEEKFVARKSAKGFPRICERMAETLGEFLEQFDENQITQENGAARELLREAAAFIADINGCTYIAETVEEFHEVFHRVTSSSESIGARVIRIKNGFLQTAGSSAGYRDMKLLLELPSSLLVVEVQILLRQFFSEKRYMHLSYEFFRGSFDWPHLPKLDGRYGEDLRKKKLQLEEDNAIKADAEKALKKAIDDQNISELEEAIKQAHHANFDGDVLSIACDLLQKLVEEEQQQSRYRALAEEKLEQLIAADHAAQNQVFTLEQNVALSDELVSAISKGKSLSVSESLMHRAEDCLNRIQSRIEELKFAAVCSRSGQKVHKTSSWLKKPEDRWPNSWPAKLLVAMQNGAVYQLKEAVKNAEDEYDVYTGVKEENQPPSVPYAMVRKGLRQLHLLQVSNMVRDALRLEDLENLKAVMVDADMEVEKVQSEEAEEEKEFKRLESESDEAYFLIEASKCVKHQIEMIHGTTFLEAKEQLEGK